MYISMPWCIGWAHIYVPYMFKHAWGVPSDRSCTVRKPYRSDYSIFNVFLFFTKKNHIYAHDAGTSVVYAIRCELLSQLPCYNSEALFV